MCGVHDVHVKIVSSKGVKVYEFSSGVQAIDSAE